MSEPLKLKVTAEPTIFNKEMLIGTILIPIPIVGSLIGGYIGKSQMKDERVSGREVSETPSFWNKDTLVGFLLGGALTLGLHMALNATGPVGEVLGAVVHLTGILAGTYIGGKAGEARMAHEYEEAKKQTIVGHISKTVSPEVGKAVEYSMEHNKDWGKHVSEERLLAEAREQGR